MRIYSKNRRVTRRVQTSVDESQANVDECRRVQTRHQTNVDKCRQVTRRVKTSVDESRDECRQIQTIVDESNIFTLIPEKVTHGPIFLLLQQQATSVCKFSMLQLYLSLLLITVFSLLILAKPICIFSHLMYVNSN